MRELIERLERADEGSLELDKAILMSFGFTWRGMNYWHHDNSTMWRGPTFFTRSLDAAVALAERVLPDGDFAWSVQQDYGGFHGAHINLFPRQYGGPVNINTNAESVPLALCIAILKAVSILRAAEQSASQEGSEPS